ncbi:hypothetical protein J1N35_014293 [Gossypium stocksii]|uniref:Uncharacterized protein n=1 Tax=Gossypium stocksii TaxID=47602 RepID=A0A9D4A9S2_9ROSI|nr:hypothetical protein J1N35_014293 [Gossypium stocksii]
MEYEVGAAFYKHGKKGAQSVELVFNRAIQLHELWTRIRKKVGDSSWERILRLQCIYLASVNPYKYELFDVKGELELEVVISSYCLSKNAIIELYVEFAEANGIGPSLATVATNVGTKLKQKVLLYGCVMRYIRTNDLLPTIESSEGTLNPLVEGDNEGADEDEAAAKKEGAEYVVDRPESDLDLIQQCGPDGLEVTLIFEL